MVPLLILIPLALLLLGACVFIGDGRRAIPDPSDVEVPDGHHTHR